LSKPTSFTSRLRRAAAPPAIVALLALGANVATGTAGAQPSGSATKGAGKPSSHRHHKPRCRPQGVPYVAISPLTGATAAPPRSQISFRGAPAADLREISVVGSLSGTHAGKLRSYHSAVGASFVPSVPFQQGEQVEVHATVKAGGGCRKIASSFTVAREAHPVYEEAFEYPGTPGEAQQYESNNIKPPTVTITQAATAAAAPGDIFATPYLGPGEHGPMIFESSGRLVWFHLLPTGWNAADFGLQTYEGAADLVWWQGEVTSLGFGLGEDVIMNDHYEVLAKIEAANGLRDDLHDIELTSSGAAFVTAYEPIRIGTAAAGGEATAEATAEAAAAKPKPKSRVVLDGVVQEIDVETGLVMWEWDSVGHVALAQSGAHVPAKRTEPYDYFHVESVQRLQDGNLRIGALGTAAVYEVGANTGKVLTREAVSAESAALNGGDEQPLENGNKLLYDGAAAGFAEYDPEGQPVYSASFPSGEISGRVYREPWSAQPTGRPGVATKASGTKTNVYVSWNGVTDVARWELLAGESPSKLTPVAMAADTGFETRFSIPMAPYVEVIALGAAGEVIAESNVKESVQEGEE
jgi:Arylsulfotransferase (ASST)